MIEHFCPGCDRSSFDNDGEKVGRIWYCKDCAKEVRKNYVEKKLREIRENMSMKFKYTIFFIGRPLNACCVPYETKETIETDKQMTTDQLLIELYKEYEYVSIQRIIKKS